MPSLPSHLDDMLLCLLDDSGMASWPCTKQATNDVRNASLLFFLPLLLGDKEDRPGGERFFLFSFSHPSVASPPLFPFLLLSILLMRLSDTLSCAGQNA